LKEGTILETKLYELVASVLHIPLNKIVDQLAMSEVESWDSLQHMNLIASLEQEFEVEFNFEEIVSMQNVATIKKVLRVKGVAV
jgi:acyl carrier protein